MSEDSRPASIASSATAFATTALAGLALLYFVARLTRPVPTTSSMKVAVPSGVPNVRFTDVTQASGISFVHENGATGARLLPETMGGGVAFFDFDADGDQDLLFVNGTHWPGQGASGKPPPTPKLFRNDGAGKFTDTSQGSGLDVSIYGMGVAVGDYDNDGFPDVFLTALGGNKLFHNEGAGRFRDVTSLAGVGGSGSDWSTSAAWFDYDRDGLLDLVVCNYVRWTPELDTQLDYRLPGIGRAYGPPMNFPGTFPFLYHNDGGGRFTDVSALAGVQVRNPATGAPLAKSLGVAPVDINADGWLDFVVANDTVQNFVFTNAHNGTFREVGAQSGLAFDSYGSPRGAMGIDTGHFEDDRALGISIGNFANEMTALYVARRDLPLFSDEAIAQGIGTPSRPSLTFGVFFFDYDLDGWLDLLTVNGHIEADIARADPKQAYLQPAHLFWNARRHGKNTFVPVGAAESGAGLFQPIAGRGSAFADLDGDGDLDVVLTQVGGPAVLLRNDQALSHHWLRLKLVGTKSNRDAIGALIRVRVGNRVIIRQVMPTRGYLSQSELPVTIGLGNATKVDSVEITWPSGGTQKFTDIGLGGLTVVTEQP